MAQKKFSDLSKTTGVDTDDLLVIERTDGTKQITFAQLCEAVELQEITEQIENFPEIAKGDSLKVIAGKINKWQSDALEKIKESTIGGGGTSTPINIDILDTKEEIEANTEQGKAAGAQAVKEMFGEINDSLTSKHYGDGTSSLVSVLNSVLTFDNIPYPQSCTFSVQSAEGYFICHATAWNGDWIGGIATPGIATQNKSFSFIRKASGGADTVINFFNYDCDYKITMPWTFSINGASAASYSGTMYLTISKGVASVSGSFPSGSTVGGAANASAASASFRNIVVSKL